jgi:hypothetical protein
VDEANSQQGKTAQCINQLNALWNIRVIQGRSCHTDYRRVSGVVERYWLGFTKESSPFGNYVRLRIVKSSGLLLEPCAVFTNQLSLLYKTVSLWQIAQSESWQAHLY